MRREVESRVAMLTARRGLPQPGGRADVSAAYRQVPLPRTTSGGPTFGVQGAQLGSGLAGVTFTSVGRLVGQSAGGQPQGQAPRSNAAGNPGSGASASSGLNLFQRVLSAGGQFPQPELAGGNAAAYTAAGSNFAAGKRGKL